jgi:hypothetical protein
MRTVADAQALCYLNGIITRTAHGGALIVRGTGYDVDHLLACAGALLPERHDSRALPDALRPREPPLRPAARRGGRG